MLKQYWIRAATMEDLRATADRVRVEVQRREDRDRLEANRATVGKCYRYRNCYSCPEKPSDYWWLYARVERLDAAGQPIGWSFQIDKDGVMTIAPLQRVHALFSGWNEITTHEFYVAYTRLMAKLKAMKSRKVRWEDATDKPRRPAR